MSYTCSRYYRAPELIFGSTSYTDSIGESSCWRAEWNRSPFGRWMNRSLVPRLHHGRAAARRSLLPRLLRSVSDVSVQCRRSAEELTLRLVTGIDQLVEIIKVLGTPSKAQILAMNASYRDHKFPQIQPVPLSQVSSPLPCPLISHLNSFSPPSDPRIGQILPKASPLGLDLLGQLLQFDPRCRVDAAEALAHPWFDDLRPERNGQVKPTMPNGREVPQLWDWTVHGQWRAFLFDRD